MDSSESDASEWSGELPPEPDQFNLDLWCKRNLHLLDDFPDISSLPLAALGIFSKEHFKKLFEEKTGHRIRRFHNDKVEVPMEVASFDWIYNPYSPPRSTNPLEIPFHTLKDTMIANSSESTGTIYKAKWMGTNVSVKIFHDAKSSREEGTHKKSPVHFPSK
jgi:hypothetical protein